VTSEWKVIRGFLSPADRDHLRARCAEIDRSWHRGRQDTGYLKSAIDRDEPVLAALIERSLTALHPGPRHGHDAWLLRYPEGSSIPPHTDPPLAAGARHARLNAIIAAPRGGGELVLDGVPVELAAGDAVLFHPDRVRHQVSAVVGGERWVWSVGCNHG
jgi:predicted 2-oxoglutarate/Fe(II)-dependent dioxygenase YbiX